MADIKVAFEEMLARRKGAAPLPTVVAHPCSEDALTGAVNAARAGLIDPVLVGPQEEIAEVAAKAKLVQAASSGFLSRSNRRPVLRHPHHMILAVPNGMAAALVRFHPATLPANPRDPMPAKGVGFPDPLSGTLNLDAGGRRR